MTRIVQSILLISMVIILGAAGCNKGAVPVKSDTTTADFSDDLSKYRPKYEAPKDIISEGNDTIIQNTSIETEADISDKLDIALDTLSARNELSGYVQGYAILVYSGTSRSEADRIRNRLYDIADGIEVPPLDYVLPTYFVRIGQFHEQIEAQSLYLKIRNYYPDATIVPQKFALQK